MNVNEKLPHKDFPKNVWPIHFAELRNYLRFFSAEGTASFFKKQQLT